MAEFSLVQTTTPQGFIHQGICLIPSGAKRGLLFIHGLSGTFYGGINLLNILAEDCNKSHLAFASFNTRGHDSIASISKVDEQSPKGYSYVNGGAGYEDFTECIDDIAGSLKFLESKGVSEVILIGHSTGANKVSFFSAETDDDRVIGVVLLSGVSDKLGPEINKQQLKQDIEMMKTLVNSNKGEGLVIGKTFFPLTPKRFLSLFTPGPEDQFDYGEKKPKLPYFSKIKKPVFVVIGEKDEHLDRSTKSFLDVFSSKTTSDNYKERVIKGADHGFKGVEESVSRALVEWSVSL